MTAVLPPIVCRHPFANDEIAAFCDAIEAALEAKSRDLAWPPTSAGALAVAAVSSAVWEFVAGSDGG